MSKSNLSETETALTERELLTQQLKQVAEGLGAMFSPFCEVVLHDLTHPEHAILAIHNNLSQREVGAPATELGLARIKDPSYPQVIANYANKLADGRPAKSTSIGIKDSSGKYVAALCLNLDLTMFQGLQAVLGHFTNVDDEKTIVEHLHPGNADSIRDRIDDFASRRGTVAHSLSVEDRRMLMQSLKNAGYLEIRRAADIIATHIGVSRATVYADTK